MLTIGKRMTWDDIIKQYPDKWVAFSSYNGWGPDVDDGVVEVVLSDEEYIEHRIAHIRDGWFYKYTTDDIESGGCVGYLSGEDGGYTVI